MEKRLSQHGAAIYITMMGLALLSGLSLMAFKVSTTEQMISSYDGRSNAISYLAESGVTMALAWATDPAHSPDPNFFTSLQTTSCVGSEAQPDWQWQNGPSNGNLQSFDPFKELGGSGLFSIWFYQSPHPDGVCVVSAQVSGSGGSSTVSVTLTRLQASITAAISGRGRLESEQPIWAHWGDIRYTESARMGNPTWIPLKGNAMPTGKPYSQSGTNEDHWMTVAIEHDAIGATGYPDNVHVREAGASPDAIPKAFLIDYAKRHGTYYRLSPEGLLVRDGISRTFSELFAKPLPDHKTPLIWIDIPEKTKKPLVIGDGYYSGYFYVAGDVRITGGGKGETILVESPPWPVDNPQPVWLDDVHLKGLLYVQGEIDIHNRFTVYGAVVASDGFTGKAANRLEVWYDHRLQSGQYAGLPPFTLLPGTWRRGPLGYL